MLTRQKPEIRTVYYANLHSINNLAAQGQSPQMGAGTPNASGMPNRLPSNGAQQNFPVPNSVSANLHIPAGKQRNSSAGAGQSQGQSSASPQQQQQMRPPNQPIQPQGGAIMGPNGAAIQANGGPSSSQIATLQRMIQQGIPIQQNGQGFIRPPMNPAMFPNATQPQGPGQSGQARGQQMPEQFMNNQQQPIDPSGRTAGPQAFRNGTSTEAPPAQQYHDRTHGALARTTWAPTAEYDTSLRERLGEFRIPLRMSARRDRVLGDVLLEKMPDAIRAIVDEVETVGEGDKGGEEVSGLPGQKKRKVQELAEGIDKGLVIEGDVETVCPFPTWSALMRC